MLDELENWSALLSRRHMPLAVVAAINAATAVNNDPAAAAAEMKMSANAVGYHGNKQCSECVHFLPPSS
jgi:hypothetical protein